ncbi:type I-B CRISPR-associated protein Cas7/Cst2/DevR [Hazenella coriacea]|uniref:CRISPR-associated Cst2 family autoregulator n=1 Tax=Hazenella coriacea TaxID=1179467 RepID=A0A4R3L4E8_9BACL|nr:type I-B CRISPR-associated protein Cas7/Cst2/DevR [Hazenella coriacea]TCS93600.1 CRISPR-associated Cst2 family autoregulator [Hazenella coriacea]
MSKGLTISMIFQANGLNYGEGIGNIAELKKLSRGNGQMYTYASRQSLRYDMVRLGHEWFNWNLQTVSKEKGTVQFREDATIEISEEMDLFGYMKTVKGVGAVTREAVARITPAISLESYKSDLEFLSNMGLAQRIGENNNLANVEQHYSFYTYTVTIDLDRIGVDRELEIPVEEKCKRVTQLLEILNLLNRQIRGRMENLSPLFVIGGVYNICNPFFLGRVQLDIRSTGYGVNTKLLQDGLEKKVFGKEVQASTHVGLAKGVFRNEDEISELLPTEQVHSVQEMFEYLTQEVQNVYAVDTHESIEN